MNESSEFIFGDNYNPQGLSMSSIGSPALLFMAGDCTGPITPNMWRVVNPNYNGDWWNVPEDVIPTANRHLGGSNILFADGHVKALAQGG